MQPWSKAMTHSDAWMSNLPPSQINAEEYDALPEDVARRIEVVDGRIIMSPSPSRTHQRLTRHLANALERLCPDMLQVDTDVDLRLADVVLQIRRPDIVVYRADLSDEAILRPEHVMLVVEVVSPNSISTDRIHKPAEYSASGIGHYWLVEMEPLEVHTFETVPLGYRETGVHRDRLAVDQPFPVEIDLSSLLR